MNSDLCICHTCAIISRGLYIYILPNFFTAVYNQERIILQTSYAVDKEILQQNMRFINKTGVKSRAGYNGGCTVNV